MIGVEGCKKRTIAALAKKYHWYCLMLDIALGPPVETIMMDCGPSDIAYNRRKIMHYARAKMVCARELFARNMPPGDFLDSLPTMKAKMERRNNLYDKYALATLNNAIERREAIIREGGE
jgi:hypothetical protein